MYMIHMSYICINVQCVYLIGDIIPVAKRIPASIQKKDGGKK
jgi:hypothetical protein